MRACLLAGPASAVLVCVPGHEVPDAHGVPHGVDVRVRCLHGWIDHDVAALAERKARLEGERVFRRDADGQDDHVGSRCSPGWSL